MGATLLIFLNKTDVGGSMNEEQTRQVSRSFKKLASRRHDKLIMIASTQALALDSIKSHKWLILPCSAMSGRNLQEGLAWVVQDAKDRFFLY